MTYFSVKKTYWKSAIKPVAHIYYWLLDGNGGYFKAFAVMSPLQKMDFCLPSIPFLFA
jgi:hypothetical protein